MSELIYVKDSAAIRCTGLPLGTVSLRAGGHKNCTSLAYGLEYIAHCFDYNKDQIDPADACMLAARLLVYDARPLCENCPNAEATENDPTVRFLRLLRSTNQSKHV